MEANLMDDNLGGSTSTSKEFSFSTPDLTKKQLPDAREHVGVPGVSFEQSQSLGALPPSPLVALGNTRPRLDKPTLLSIPIEVRRMILRKVLGDQKVHVHYKLGLHTFSRNSEGRTGFTQYLPQYVFCHHAEFMEDPSLRQLTGSVKRYEHRHDLCHVRGLSLNKKSKSASRDPSPTSETATHLRPRHQLPESVVPSPESVELMNESFELRLSILAVSHQLREEAMEVYYKTNTFSFNSATYFNIFVSQITDKKASLLREVEFINDLEDFFSLGDMRFRLSETEPWSLGVKNTAFLMKLANTTSITIGYYNLHLIACRGGPDDSNIFKITQLNERLRRDFGGLGTLKNITQVHVRVYDHTHAQWGWSGTSMTDPSDACVKNIGDTFAKEILNGC